MRRPPSSQHQGDRDVEDLPLRQEVLLITGGREQFVVVRFHYDFLQPIEASRDVMELAMLREPLQKWPLQSSSLLLWQGDRWVTGCLYALWALPEQHGRQHTPQGCASMAPQSFCRKRRRKLAFLECISSPLKDIKWTPSWSGLFLLINCKESLGDRLMKLAR